MDHVDPRFLWSGRCLDGTRLVLSTSSHVGKLVIIMPFCGARLVLRITCAFDLSR